MTVDEFKASLAGDVPPHGVGKLLQAMWHDAKGDWVNAHKLAQDVQGSQGALVHAYLHRKEGDLSNASYWYGRAGSDMPEISLDAEWEGIVRRLLK